MHDRIEEATRLLTEAANILRDMADETEDGEGLLMPYEAGRRFTQHASDIEGTARVLKLRCLHCGEIPNHGYCLCSVKAEAAFGYDA